MLLLTGGGCAIVDYPAQTVPATQEEGDPFTEVGIAGYTYDQLDRVFLGGHVYDITEEEAERLIACGYGEGVTGDPTWEGAEDHTWDSLGNWEEVY